MIRPYFFTDSIDVCAVAGTGHALYRDIRLSGNWMRKTGLWEAGT